MVYSISINVILYVIELFKTNVVVSYKFEKDVR